MRARVLAALTGAILVLSACGSASQPSDSQTLISIHEADLSGVALPAATPVAGGAAVDRAGRATVVADPSRIVSVATGVAEIINAMGVTEALVGRDLKSEAKALETIPVVTDVHALNAEKVLSLHPTLLIVDAQTTPTKTIDQIEQAGVQVIALPEVWSLTQVEDRVRQLGTALGLSDRAEQLLAAMDPQTELRTVKYRKVAFLYLRGTSSIYLIGGKESGADSLLAAAGATDLGAEAGLAPFAPLTPETLVAMQPDVILVMTKGLESVGGVDGLVKLPGVKQTPAAKAKRVIAVDDGLLLAFDTRCLQLVDRLNEALASYE